MSRGTGPRARTRPTAGRHEVWSVDGAGTVDVAIDRTPGSDRVLLTANPGSIFDRFWSNDNVRWFNVQTAQGFRPLALRWVERLARQAAVNRDADTIVKWCMANEDAFPERLAAASETLGTMQYDRMTPRQSRAWRKWARLEQARIQRQQRRALGARHQHRETK